MAPLRTILVPVDFSDASGAALRWALDLGARVGAKVDVVHVWNEPAYAGAEDMIVHDVDGGTRPLREVVARQAARDLEAFLGVAAPGVSIDHAVAGGRPEEVILERAKAHDLVVMGTHGRHGVARLVLGSVADRVSRNAPCPVVTVKP